MCRQLTGMLQLSKLAWVGNVTGVMQASGGSKLEKRYSPSFREDTFRGKTAAKRKRDDVFK